ncbi:hypothetical protein B0H10DRAFT_1977319 [Mycena sp. CBHHK59/15]|nr:hypothetical protein B0H10DRAFT_1977319 [Mycena sp. CBHHK59/15]
MVYDPLCRCNRTSTLELVLGIKPSGTSHLLLTAKEMDELAYRRIRNLRCQDIPTRVGDYESLSPIVFAYAAALQSKLDALTPKGPNPARDTSENKRFDASVRQESVKRGHFENNRLFYRVLQNEVDGTKYGVRDIAWTSSVRVFSFAYNLWSRDERSRLDREQRPRVLDIGWCEAQTPGLGEEMRVSRHIVLENNQRLSNPDKETYEYGETETLNPQKVEEEIQHIFRQYTQPTSTPVVLLVYNEQTALNVLRSLNVDVSAWNSGTKDLLRPAEAAPRRLAPNDPRRLPDTRDRRDRPTSPTRRARSASPHRGGPSPSRRASPPPRRLYAPVYVIDVRAMGTALLETTDGAGSVPALCARLKLYNPSGWCAGNECRCVALSYVSLRPVS